MTKVPALGGWQGVVRELADFDIVLSMRERTAFPASLLARLPTLKRLGAIVRARWRGEFANVLLQAERRGRVWKETLILARSEKLTTYDATHLGPALRSGLPLLTKDAELAAAARRRGVTVLP
jgi:hypothetical protein